MYWNSLGLKLDLLLQIAHALLRLVCYSFLISGVCLGMQLAVVEFARNVLEWKDAQSTEFNPDTTHPVVIEMPEHNPGQMGATMRLGKRKTLFKSKDSLLSKSL